MTYLLLLALAQQTPVELLKQLDENYQSMKTFHIEADMIIESRTDTNRNWNRRQSVVIMESPTKLRFTANGFLGQYEVVADGTTVWRVAGHLRKYVASPVSGSVFDTKGGGNESINALTSLRMALPSSNVRSRRLKSAEFLPDEAVLDAGKVVVCRVVRAQYEPALSQTLWERTFWVDPVRLLVLKETSTSEGAASMLRPFEKSHSESTTQYRHLHLGSLPKDYDFQFVPPPNYAGVDKLEVTGMTVPKQDLLGKPAPDLVSQYKGKLVLVHFWATWCGPCREQMPAVVKLHRQIKDQGVVMIGVNCDESEETMKEYAKKNGLDWLQWMDKDHRAKFKVEAIPTLIVVDREGKIAAYEVGNGVETENSIRKELARQGVKF